MPPNPTSADLAVMEARLAANRGDLPAKRDRSRDEEEEATLQKAAHDYLDAEGIYYHHDRDRRKDEPGVPDDLICYRGFVAAEAKSRTGKVEKEQQEHMARIRKSGGRTFVFRSLREFIEKLHGEVNETHPR